MRKSIRAHQFMSLINKIHIDPNFQRRACWSIEKKRNFILSLNKGRVINPIVVSCARTGLEASVTGSVSSEKYNSILKNNEIYVSLDGQNRTNTIKEFFNDKLNITGDFIDADGMTVGVTNKLFSQLPNRLRDALKDANVEFHIMEGVPYDELNDIFLSINDGVPLNEQQRRNAISTPISPWFRELAESYVQMWTLVQGFKDRDLEMFKDVEWTVKFYMGTLQDYNILTDNPGMDHFYNLGKGQTLNQVKEYRGPRRQRFTSILNITHSLVKAAKTLEKYKKNVIPRKYFHSFILLAEYLHDNQILNSIPNGLSPNGYKELAELTCLLDEKLSKKSDKQFSVDIDKFDKGLIKDEPKRNQYYSFWRTNWKAPSLRNSRKTLLLTEIINHQEYNAIIAHEMITDEESIEESEEVA